MISKLINVNELSRKLTGKKDNIRRDKRVPDVHKPKLEKLEALISSLDVDDCPECGSDDISLSFKYANYTCGHCRFEWFINDPDYEKFYDKINDSKIEGE